MKTSSLIIALAVFSQAMVFAGDAPLQSAPVYSSGKSSVIVDQPYAAPCLSYDYIDLDYGITDTGNDFLNDNSGTLGISFSKSLGESLFLTGGYTYAGFEYLDNNQFRNLDSHELSLGLGGRFQLSDCVDLTFEGGVDYRNTHYAGNQTFNNDSWGYYVGPGIRARAGRFEGYAKVFYVGQETVVNQFALSVEGWVFKPGILFHMTDNLALKLAGDIGENFSTADIGLRINF